MKSGHRQIVNLSTYSTVCDSTVDIRHFKNCVVQAVDTVIWLKLAVGCSKAIFFAYRHIGHYRRSWHRKSRKSFRMADTYDGVTLQSLWSRYDRHFVLNVEDLSCYSNKTESVSLRMCPYDHRLTNKAHLSAITVTNVSRSLTDKMAAQINWHRYEQNDVTVTVTRCIRRCNN